MAEYIQSGHWKQAAPAALIDNTVLRRDLYHLALAFVASRDITAFALDPQLARLPDLWNEFCEEEVSLRLSTTAVLIRARDDYVLRLLDQQLGPQDWAKELRDGACGTLQPNLKKDRIIPLKLREACNKVLHAIEYRFHVEGDGPDRCIKPLLYLYGTERNGQEWKATLEVLRYVELGTLYAQG